MSDRYHATLIYGFLENTLSFDPYKKLLNGLVAIEHGWGNGNNSCVVIGYELHSNDSHNNSEPTEILNENLLSRLNKYQKEYIDAAAKSLGKECKVYLLWGRK